MGLRARAVLNLSICSLNTQNFGFQGEGRFSSRALSTGRPLAGGVARASVSQRRGRSPAALDSSPAPPGRRGHGGPEPRCLCAALGAGIPVRGPRAPRKYQELGRGASAREGNAPHSCRPAEGGKKKKVEKEAFQVKLLGSEKPRFRATACGGRTHGVQGSLLPSAAQERRGCAASAPRPGGQRGPTWSSAAPAERAVPPGSPERAPQLPAAAVHAGAPPPVPRVPR